MHAQNSKVDTTCRYIQQTKLAYTFTNVRQSDEFKQVNSLTLSPSVVFFSGSCNMRKVFYSSNFFLSTDKVSNRRKLFKSNYLTDVDFFGIFR